MAISSTLTKNTWLGNGVATSFPYQFRINDAAHLVVILTDPSGAESEVDPSLYAVTGVGESEGGVTYPLTGAPLAAGWSITLARRTPRKQETDLDNQGGLYLAVIERSLDGLTMMVQEQQEQLDRAAKLPISSPESADDLIASVRESASAAATSAANAAAGAATATDRAAVATGAAEMATAAEANVAAIAASLPLMNGDGISADHQVALDENGWVFEATSAAQAIVITLPNSEAALATEDAKPGFSIIVQRRGANPVTVVPNPDDPATVAGVDAYVIPDGAGARFTLNETPDPNNWIVTPFGAAVGDAEPVGAVKTLATVEPGYLALNDSYFQVAETVPGAGDGYTALAAKMYVGDASNATAPYFYRFTDPGNPSGTRSTTGPYMKLPPSTAYRPVVYKAVDLGVRTTTTGTAVDWDVPAGAERVVVSLYDVSTNGTSPPVIRIGQGAPDTTGYASYASQLGSAVETGSLTSGFRLINTSAASIAFLGQVEIARDADGSFACSTRLGYSSPGTINAVGRKSISSFDKLRLTTVGGTDTFDAGSARAVAYVPVVYPGVVCIKAANSISVPVDVNLAGILAETQAQNALVQSYFAGSGSGAPVNVTGSRAAGTTYTNTSDRPRLVNVTAGTSGSATQLVVGGVVAAQVYTNTTAPMSAVVPPGVTYSVTSGASITYWGETALITPGGMGPLSQTILGNTFPLVMGIQTIAHTLGKSPSRVEVRARCTVAEYGWAVGEGFTVWTAGPNNSDGGYSVLDRSASSVSLGWAAGYGSGKILKQIRKDTGAIANLTTNGNWVFDLELFE